MNTQTIGKALLETWKKESLTNTEHSGVISLRDYLDYNHKERHVKLCLRCNVKPKSLGEWLKTPLYTLI